MEKSKIWLVVGVALCTTACDQTKPTTAKENEGGIGRYVIVHSPHIQRDTVLLDTVTGKTWSQVEHTYLEDEPVVWEPVARSDNETEWAAMREAHPPKKKAAGSK